MKNGKLVLCLILVSLFFVTSIPTQVSAHDLVWGIMPNDTFEYSSNGELFGEDVDIDFSLTITELRVIDDTEPSWPLVGIIGEQQGSLTNYYARYLENSSIFYVHGEISWLFGRESMPVLPINDWNYLSTLENRYENVETVSFQNSTHWGYTSTQGPAIDPLETRYITVTAIYLKENGVLQSFSSYDYDTEAEEVMESIEIKIITQITTTTSGTTSTTTTTTTTTGSTPPDMTLILILGGGILAVVVIVAIVKMRS